MKAKYLLMKILNEEEVPKQVKYKGEIYDFYKDAMYKATSYKRGGKNGVGLCLDGLLDTELEIIEEDKEIEELDYCEENTFSNMKEITYLTSEERRLLDSNFKSIKEKFDELIKAVNSIKKGN